MLNQTLPKNFKLVAHLTSVLIPGILLGLLLVWAWKGIFVLSILIASLLVLGYYALAGGFDWKEERLSTLRVVLFAVLSYVVLGLILAGVWLLIRYILATIYKIPMKAAMGRLLTVKQAVPPVTISTGAGTDAGIESQGGLLCEKCGARTDIGAHYGVSYAYETAAESRTTTVGAGLLTTTTIHYRKSEPVYVFLCHKCVSLKGPRDTSVIFNRIIVISAVALLLAIPVSIVLENQLFLLPALFLLFLGPVAFYQHSSLRAKEKLPLRDFSGLADDPARMPRGEELAVRLRWPIMKSLGVNAVFTPSGYERIISRRRYTWLLDGVGWAVVPLLLSPLPLGLLIQAYQEGTLGDPGWLLFLVPASLFIGGVCFDLAHRSVNKVSQVLSWIGVSLNILWILIAIGAVIVRGR